MLTEPPAAAEATSLPDAATPDVAPVERAHEPPRRRCWNDRGSTSLSVALLTPLLVVLMFAAVQAALWGHARTEARSVARRTAALVARSDVGPGDARATAAANLADGDLTDVVVLIDRRGGDIVVTISGRAPGIIRGTARDVSVVEAVPVEEVASR
ncbi:MAG: TadE family protein [Actinomycetota bacterium]